MTGQELLAKKLMALLRLERRPVGVKLTYSKDEYDTYEAVELSAPLEYCVAVRSAGLGHCVKFTKENSRCSGSTVALGFCPPAEIFYNGEHGCALGLFRDPAVAAQTNKQMKILKKPLYGVIAKPLEQFSESNPDVVIVIGIARELMRLVQGYTCTYGMQPNLNITGNQAVCVECTAYPLLTKDMNLSMLCSGTRYLAQWKDEEVGIGIPYEKFEGTVQGIWDTVNGTEMDVRKAEIKGTLEALGCRSDNITMQSAYYLPRSSDRKKG